MFSTNGTVFVKRVNPSDGNLLSEGEMSVEELLYMSMFGDLLNTFLLFRI